MKATAKYEILADLPSLTLSTSDLNGLMDFMLDNRQPGVTVPTGFHNTPHMTIRQVASVCPSIDC